MHDKIFFNITLRLEAMRGYTRWFGFQGAICILRLVFSSGKAILKSVLRFVAAYLQARNEPAGDRPRRDFWLIVSRSCACHSPQTVLDTTSISALLVPYQLLLKCTKFQQVGQLFRCYFIYKENARHAHSALAFRNLKFREWQLAFADLFLQKLIDQLHIS